MTQSGDRPFRVEVKWMLWISLVSLTIGLILLSIVGDPLHSSAGFGTALWLLGLAISAGLAVADRKLRSARDGQGALRTASMGRQIVVATATAGVLVVLLGLGADTLYSDRAAYETLVRLALPLLLTLGLFHFVCGRLMR
jgi:hypothetical protein